jgi:shikimate kinase
MSARPQNRQGLALVGTRGTGKSTVGRILAERLVRPFLDADVELEEKLGRSIAAIFAADGEAFFRDREEQVLSDLTARHPGAILATGGGVVLRETNCRALRSFGFVVWLWTEPALAARRLQADPRGLELRPALTPAGTTEELAGVLEARTPLYQSVADTVVDTTGRTAEDVAEVILGLWNPSQHASSSSIDRGTQE